MKASIYLIFALLVFAGCSAFRSSTPAADSGGKTLVTAASLCTTWVDYEAKPLGSGANLSVRCLDSAGAWVAASYARDPRPGAHFGEPSLALASNGDVLALYHRDSAQNGFQIAVSRSSPAGWLPLAELVNSDKGSLVEAYSQFGASLTEFQGKPFVFWTGLDSNAFLSQYDGSSWTHVQIQDGPKRQILRHPEILNTGSDLFVFYGSPRPTVWHWNGAQLESLGSVALQPNEITLYASLVLWQGQPVIAYSSDDSPNNWGQNHSKVKVAIRKGGAWSSLGEVQDLAGHDGVNPFLFTIGGDLYVLYGDNSTDGLSTDPSQLRLRFRVKKWNGVTFARFGDESPAVALSQRFEFSINGDAIYFSAVVVPSSGPSSQVVLSWRNGVFSQVGGALATKTKGFWRARPGRVIATEGIDLSAVSKGNLLFAPTVKPGLNSSADPVALLPRFLDSAAFNFRPQSSSPMIDAGASCDASAGSDADELTRPAGFRCDVGAYEF